ncbi:hypothetical protein [Hyphomonas sp.]|uniref:hypothetical protein n=1 Tax=Hyphomonas sp. TaxID=87 RepID=UPI0025BAB65D|nr:hypothetical protein [Hyphomonas sp.]
MPLDYRTGDETWCAAYLVRPPRWDRARVALINDETSRRPILDLKPAGRCDGLPTLAGWMRQAGGVLIDEVDVLVPAPLHDTRLVMRGFNQSGWPAGPAGATFRGLSRSGPAAWPRSRVKGGCWWMTS